MYIKIQENLDSKEFEDLKETISCNIEGTTHFSYPIELAFSGGIYSMYCYAEEHEEKEYILFSVNYVNDKKLYDIWEEK